MCITPPWDWKGTDEYPSAHSRPEGSTGRVQFHNPMASAKDLACVLRYAESVRMQSLDALGEDESGAANIWRSK